jgi:serine/threonine protein kinase
MRCSGLPDLASLSAEQAQWVSEVCNEFEEQWARTDRPSVPDIMRRLSDSAEPATRLVLLRELLNSELELHEREAKGHGIDAYRARFNTPGEIDVVEFVLGETARADGTGRFHVVRRHAHGGLGEVFIAHDRHVDRDVALKKIKPAFADDDVCRNRFIREAEITGQLEHPNIAPVYALGLDDDDLPFYAMRFIDGRPLDLAISELAQSRQANDHDKMGPLGLRKLLGRLNAVCDAVAFAHSRGVLHRDIKPANIILGRFGETILVDWGLAKRLAATAADPIAPPASLQGAGAVERMTEQGSVLGTLPYMSPEQARSAGEPLRPASDIYSLGATLYHIVTGQAPFSGKDHERVRGQVIAGAFPPPRRVKPGVPRALEAIVLKAMALEPAGRYATALELAADIDRWLADEPVRAWREPPSVRLARRLRRHRIVVYSTAAALFVGLIGLAGFASVLAGKNRELDSRRRQAVDERNRAEQARDTAFNAVKTILLTDTDEMLMEETRPYRARLLDKGLALSREIVAASTHDTRSTKLLAQALELEANIYLEKGDRAHASELNQQAVKICESWVADDPHNREKRDALAQALHLDAVASTNREARSSSSRRAIEILTELIRQDPESPDAADRVSIVALSLHNIGDGYIIDSRSAGIELRPGLLQKAIDAFLESRSVCNGVHNSLDRQNPRIVHALALCARYLCRAYRSLGPLLSDAGQSAEAKKAAIEWGKTAISEFQSLSDRYPDSYQRAWELHQAQRELGIAYMDQEKHREAIEAYTTGRSTLDVMKERYGGLISRRVQVMEAIAADDHNLVQALTSAAEGDELKASKFNNEAYEICEKLEVVRPLSINLRSIYAFTAFVKADELLATTGVPDVELNRKAAKLYESLLIDDPPKEFYNRCFLFLVRLELADALAARNLGDESKKVEDEASAVVHGRRDVLFQTALTYGSGTRDLESRESKLEPKARERLRKRYSGRVISLLREAVSAGYSDDERLRKDRDFSSFQSDPSFKAIVAQAARNAKRPSQP